MEANKNNSTFKKILFVGIVILLTLPMLQQTTGFFEPEPLKGDFVVLEKPTLTSENWWSGEFQEEYEGYMNQNIGFRPFFVRTYNQMQFSLFNQAKANGVIIGKDNYLYEEHYITAYLGEDFLGKEKIVEKIEKLKRIQDTLSTKGIELIVVFAPGKASFYPEFIPDGYDIRSKTTTNYEVYADEITKTNIHFLDFNQWFLNTKNTSKYPLMPKTGIHWSKYGELIAADSIIKYINGFQMDKKLPSLLIGEIETSQKMRDTDNDIEEGMNLLFRMNSLKMAYPRYSFEEKSTKTTAKVLTIADSFYWGMFNFGLSRDAFNNGQFWYYNQQVYPDSYEKALNVEDISIIDEVEKNDVVVLMSTEANLYKFAFGFIDQLYAAYFE